jgi:hypothetical protein
MRTHIIEPKVGDGYSRIMASRKRQSRFVIARAAYGLVEKDGAAKRPDVLEPVG